MPKDSFYFQHDYNAKTDVKCLFLRQQLGMEGYGIFWFLVESLAEAGGSLPLKIIPVLAMQMQVTEIKVSAVIQNFELFKILDNCFFSIRLNEHLNVRKVFSEQGKKGAMIRWKNSHPNSQAITPPNGEPYAKERKGKEIVAAPSAQQQQKNDEFLFQCFKNASNWSTELILEQIGFFKNKYPDLPANKSGPVVNSWIANYKPKNKNEENNCFGPPLKKLN